MTFLEVLSPCFVLSFFFLARGFELGYLYLQCTILQCNIPPWCLHSFFIYAIYLNLKLPKKNSLSASPWFKMLTLLMQNLPISRTPHHGFASEAEIQMKSSICFIFLWKVSPKRGLDKHKYPSEDSYVSWLYLETAHNFHCLYAFWRSFCPIVSKFSPDNNQQTGFNIWRQGIF